LLLNKKYPNKAQHSFVDSNLFIGNF